MTKKPTVLLYELNGIGLIIPWLSGVVYQNQTGGYHCYQNSLEGIFVPLESDMINFHEKLYDHFYHGKWGGWCELASFLIEHGQFPLALRAAQQYQLANPEEVHHHLLAARIYSAWGRRDDAHRTLERAAAVFPDSAAVKRALEGGIR